MTHRLDPAIYWQLRALTSETQRFAALIQQARDAMTMAKQKQDDLVLQLALQYGFDPKTAMYGLDDASLSIQIPDETPTMP